MRKVGAHISLHLQAISDLLGRDLSLTDSFEEGPNLVLADDPSPQKKTLSLHCKSGQPFTSPERVMLRSALDLIRRDSSASADYQSLRQKLRRMEVENAKLYIENQGLAEASSKDSLTGLYNRFYVLDKIESELNRALRHGSATSLLMIDIDHFKKVNDSYGHPAGDQVLQSVGRVLRDSCRVYDIPGRYGGEEFCVLLPETRLDGTTKVAERIRGKLETTPLRLPAANIQVTASIGVAGMDESQQDVVWSAASLIERADRALYTAKRMGRNRIEYWDPSLHDSLVSVGH